MRRLEEALQLLAGQDGFIDPEELIDRIEQSLSDDGVPLIARERSQVMQTQEKRLQKTRRVASSRAWILAAVLMTVVVAIGVPVWLLGRTEPQDVIRRPGAVFGMRSDSCEWFTPEDMNRIVADAQQRAGTDFIFEEFTPWQPAKPLCWTYQTDPGQGVLHLWATKRWLSPTTNDGWMVISISSFDEAVALPDEFVRHPSLDDAVSYHTAKYHSGGEAGLGVVLQVDGHEDETIDFGLAVGDNSARFTPKYEELGLAIANELLKAMNWIDVGE